MSGFRFVQFANADDLERVWRQPGHIRAHSILVILLIYRSDICCGLFLHYLNRFLLVRESDRYFYPRDAHIG